MSGSKYAYVKAYEQPDPILPNTFVVVRLDGHSFHRFSDEHAFQKPNDERALKLMDHAACDVMDLYPDVVLGFGESDEFSFLLRRSTALYNRRHSKILTTLCSQFTSSYVFHWPKYFPDTPLRYPPSFDGRIALYPTEKEVRDYFAWRQVDTHINNLYNTTFWALIQQGGHNTTEAHKTLKGTVSKDKHEILFSRYGINYNDLPARYRKGSVLVREEVPQPEPPGDVSTQSPDTMPNPVAVNSGDPSSPNSADPVIIDPQTSKSIPARAKNPGTQKKAVKAPKPMYISKILHVDLIGDAFWNERGEILSG